MWLTSKQTQKYLKISGCQLMHKREHGELKFEKRGNAFFYYFDSISADELRRLQAARQ
ncbi:hypothetical protein ACFFK7_03155 [Pseudoalteromonas xiamenensis]|uniref:hypothetical protein n=1 Tax=Pseudoalteromonas xiamenensis TaxID=882626 RepID=UPI0035EE859B